MKWFGIRSLYTGQVDRYDPELGLLVLHPFNVYSGTYFRDHVWLREWYEGHLPHGTRIEFYGSTFLYVKKYVKNNEEKRKLQLGLRAIFVKNIGKPVEV